MPSPVTDPVIARIRQLQADSRLFAPGGVVVAVSGGADSLTLLHALRDLRHTLGITLHVATLDHGLRGTAGAADAQFVREVADQWGLPVTTERIDLPAQMATAQAGSPTNLEAAARQARYHFLARVAADVGALCIVTGHTLDDQAETILLHLLRGTGLAGLRGMRPKTPLTALQLSLPAFAEDLQLVRPLLTTPRTEIDAYCAAHLRPIGVEPRTDATNADLTFTRNRLRHEIMPALAAIAPTFRGALGRMAMSVSDDYDVLVAALPPLEPLSGMRDVPSSAGGYLPVADFRALPSALQRLLLIQTRKRLFPEDAHSLDFEAAHTAQQFIANARSAATLDGWIHVHAGRLYLMRELPYPDTVPQLTPEFTVRFTAAESAILLPLGWRLLIARPDDLDAPPLPIADDLRAVLRLPTGAALELRPLRRGERFKPAGLGGQSQKVSDLLVNLKVPAAWRGRVPALIVNEEVAWIVAPLMGGAKSRIAEPFSLTIGQRAANDSEIVQLRYDFVLN